MLQPDAIRENTNWQSLVAQPGYLCFRVGLLVVGELNPVEGLITAVQKVTDSVCIRGPACSVELNLTLEIAHRGSYLRLLP